MFITLFDFSQETISIVGCGGSSDFYVGCHHFSGVCGLVLYTKSKSVIDLNNLKLELN